MSKELTAEQVSLKCDPELFQCRSTGELAPKSGIIGQDRALSALKFGLNCVKPGFNIFVSGPAGTGRTTAIKSFLEEIATKKDTAADWCYVNNFRDPYCPRALKLPVGMGQELQRDMKHTVENARRSLAQAFTSKEYAERRAEVSKDFTHKREVTFKRLDKRAKAKGLLMQTTQVGLILVPAAKGEPMGEEAYKKLGAKEKDAIRKNRDELTAELHEEIAKLRVEESSLEKQLEETDREVARYSVSHIFEDLGRKYGQLPQVIAYLKEVEGDVVENFEQFKTEPKPPESNQAMAMQMATRQQVWKKYEVNVLIDNSELKGAPVILELNPTFSNLLGRIEKEAQFGALYTDFTMIKSGSLHRANGGFLVLRIEDLLTNYQSWEGLKRTIRDGKVNIEEISERLGFVTTKSLKPEPVPLEIKVVVIGEPMFYHLLWRLDLEFKELFKVKAEFDSRMDKTRASLKDYAGVICRMCQSEELCHLSRDALAKVIEHSSRLAGDQEKLSTLFADIADIIREANFWSKEEGKSLIEAEHLTKALEQKVYRSNLIQQRINEMIEKGVIFIDTDAEKTGQVNGLEVIDLGDFTFGKPARITASVGVGREGLIDIEREAKLGGPIHSKGVMILSGYIADKYTSATPLSLAARLVFEQSYQEVEGDSASSTELYAILSRLADAPIKQGIAVTGSINQKGEIQAIGGVNEKIEGFFEVCRAKGLNGKQGALIPASNVKNLMLKEAVVEAVSAGKFHIYPVSTADEGIELLTGQKAGKRRKDGRFAPNSINDRVQRRLLALAERLRDFTRGAKETHDNEEGGKDK